MKHRPGVTLLEVLAAIFIMGIGLLALLTLFPLGASTMTQALKDARSVEAGNNARASSISLGIRQDPNITALFAGPQGQLPPTWNGASYPVYADPMGVWYIGSMPQTITGTQIPRTFFNQAATASNAMRWCSLWDDYQFDDKGSANLPAGVSRQSQYTWAYMVKRWNYQNASVVDVTVVVYAGRNLQVPGGESAYNTNYTFASPKSVILTYNGDKPNLKKGGWLLDVSTHNLVTDTANALRFGPVHGFFYRVDGFTEVNPNQIEVVLETVPTAPITSVSILDNVAGVFSIGTGRP